MPEIDSVLRFILFMALLLAATSCGLAASGHFPAEHRAAALRSPGGRIILFAAMAVAAICLLADIVAACLRFPWYAIVIGGGGVLCLVPLALRPLSDAFINGRSALIGFAGASLVLVILLLMTYGWRAG